MPEFIRPYTEDDAKSVKERWEERHAEEERLPEDELETRFGEFIEKYKDEIGPTILDIGSGQGRQTIPLLEKGYKVTGFEITEEGIKKTKEQIGSNSSTENEGRFVQGDFHHLPFQDNSFDTAISVKVMHNNTWGGAEQTFRELARVIKPNGLAFVQVRSENSKAEPDAMKLADKGHTWTVQAEGKDRRLMHDFTLEELTELANVNGMEVVEAVDERSAKNGVVEKGIWNMTLRKNIQEAK